MLALKRSTSRLISAAAVGVGLAAFSAAANGDRPMSGTVEINDLAAGLRDAIHLARERGAAASTVATSADLACAG